MNSTQKTLLRTHNMRVTPVLEEIMSYLKAEHIPCSAHEMLSVLDQKGLSPHKTTVYRILEKLTEINILQETIGADAIRRYCLVTDGHHHHFTCTKCGNVEHIPQSVCKSVLASLEQDHHTVTGHTIEVTGICNICNT